MNDKELADKILAVLPIGLLHWDRFDGMDGMMNTVGLASYAEQDAHGFVRDWRIAGAIIVMLREKGFSWLLHTYPDGKALMTITGPITNAAEHADPSKVRSWAAQIVDEDDARAIIEAGVEALSHD